MFVKNVKQHALCSALIPWVVDGHARLDYNTARNRGHASARIWRRASPADGVFRTSVLCARPAASQDCTRGTSWPATASLEDSAPPILYAQRKQH